MEIKEGTLDKSLYLEITVNIKKVTNWDDSKHESWFEISIVKHNYGSKSGEIKNEAATFLRRIKNP